MYIELYGFFKALLSCVGIKNENLSNIFFNLVHQQKSFEAF